MPYRDDQAALEARLEELRRDHDEATRKADALADAEAEKARIAAELAAVEAKLRRSGSRRLPLLDRISIASPCSASWDDMVGDDRVRFCGKCEKNVYNFSSMQSAEAEALIKEHEGNLCVRLFRRQDGTVLTADCPVGVRKKRVRRLVVLAAGAGAVTVSATTWLFAEQGKPMMGDVSVGGAALPVEPATLGSVAVEAPAPPSPTATETPKVKPAPVPSQAPVKGKLR
jgi:hypothetical protein